MSKVVLDSDFACVFCVFFGYLMCIVGGARGLRFSLPTTYTSVILLDMEKKNFEP